MTQEPVNFEQLAAIVITVFPKGRIVTLEYENDEVVIYTGLRETTDGVLVPIEDGR